MLGDLFAMLIETIGGFFVMLLIVRAVMRWMRISSITQVGQFVLSLTNWLVVPAQKLVPSVGRLDLACLLPAWVLEALIVLLSAWARSGLLSASGGVAMAVLTIAVFELVKTAIYLLIGVVLISVILIGGPPSIAAARARRTPRETRPALDRRGAGRRRRSRCRRARAGDPDALEGRMTRGSIGRRRVPRRRR